MPCLRPVVPVTRAKDCRIRFLSRRTLHLPEGFPRRPGGRAATFSNYYEHGLRGLDSDQPVSLSWKIFSPTCWYRTLTHGVPMSDLEYRLMLRECNVPTIPEIGLPEGIVRDDDIEDVANGCCPLG